MSTRSSDQDLRDRLQRWVAAGLLDPEQAGRIERAEAARAQPPARVPARHALVVEALGYVGGALAILAGFLAVNQLWPDIPLGAQLAFAAGAAVALGGAGTAVQAGTGSAFRRLRSVLWLLATACVAAFTGLLAGQVWRLPDLGAVTFTAAVTTVCAALLWWWSRAPLQHIATFAATAATVGALIAWLAAAARSWAPGGGVWLVSLAWAYAVYRGYLRPRPAGYLAAVAGLLVGAQLTMAVAAGHVLALATVAGLLVTGVLLRRVWLLIVGAGGVVAIVPQTAVRYLPQAMGAPLAMLAVGLTLLAAALWLSRRYRRPGGAPPA